ncbi:helix-turn-helix transcriptional regulator [Clostridium sp.]|jgi:putative transcriptional regulator|uniref:helix-turn-helix transcriptional regulator n=1 Tax=Clostridium sp. TaxID=1506 RepID=UPI0025829086|nr:helix-turn-helix transcriptional regulator [Clostridium sp.]MDF2505601.1 transcriptional regulator, family [Clostridium sp.]
MNNLKQLRGNKSQKEIADKVGITTSHYGFIENGERQPSLKVAKKIADVFDKKIEEIFFDNSSNISLGVKLKETG